MVNKKTKKGGANINIINNNKSLFIELDENDYIIEGSITTAILTDLINPEYNFMLNDNEYKEFLNYYYVGIEKDFIIDANLVLEANNKILIPVEMTTGRDVHDSQVFQQAVQAEQPVYGGSKKKTRKNKNKKKKTKRKIKKSKQIKGGGHNPPQKEMKKKKV